MYIQDKDVKVSSTSVMMDSGAKVIMPVLDNKGNKVTIVDGVIDLRDYDIVDIISIIEKNIRNNTHRGSNKVLLPVGWILISTDEYNKRMKPSWWRGTKYETPILIIKLCAVFLLVLTIPYRALSRMENMPDEWRIIAKTKQSSTGV